MDKKILSKYSREFQIEKRAIDKESRTVELAFSSEEPYERWFGTEILSHDTESVDLGRLQKGGAVLVDHDTTDHVGVVESVRIDADRVGRAVVRFGKGQRATEIFNDVDDGIRTNVSVGYQVDKYEVTENKDASDSYLMTRWMPLEISLVSVPADATVGVGRSNDDSNQPPIIEEIKMDKKEEVKPVAAPAVNVAEVQAKARKDEQGRIRLIMSTAEKHDCEELGRDFIDSGKTYADFQHEVLKVIGERNVEIRAKQPAGDDKTILGLSEKEKDDYSLTRVMRALADPNNPDLQKQAAFELEVSHEGSKQLGITPRGFFIPSDVPFGRADLSAGTATDGAELVADTLLPGSFIDVLRNTLVTAQAGMTMLPGLVGTVDIPRKTSGSAATWITAEDGDATQSDPQFDQVSLAPKDLGVYTQVTRRLMQQATPSIDAIVRDDLAKGMAIGIDAAALYGTGANGQPKGVSVQTGINSFDLTAAAPTYAETVQMVKEVMGDNALMGNLGYIIDPAGWEDAMTTVKDSGSGMFIMSEGGTINGYRTQVSNQVAAEDWFFGNWTDLLMGLWGGLELNVDPYTHSLKGKTRYVAFQTVDVAVRHPVSFCWCNDAIT